jgi:hypothetical protein
MTESSTSEQVASKFLKMDEDADNKSTLGKGSLWMKVRDAGLHSQSSQSDLGEKKEEDVASKRVKTFKDVVQSALDVKKNEGRAKMIEVETEKLIQSNESHGSGGSMFFAMARFNEVFSTTDANFGGTKMLSLSWWYIKQDRILCVLTFAMITAAVLMSFWGPQWIAVALRLVFGAYDGNLHFEDFIGWLFLYVVTVAILWAATSSLLYIMQQQFMQRLKWHITVVGSDPQPQVQELVSLVDLNDLENQDLLQTSTMLFRALPTFVCGVCVYNPLFRDVVF